MGPKVGSRRPSPSGTVGVQMTSSSQQGVHATLRLVDPWGGDDVVREMLLAELETSERGVAIGPTFYPWRRVVSYEWEILENAPEEELMRPRQLLVRVLAETGDGNVVEHRVSADRFEVGSWTVSMLLPERVEPESDRVVFRRLTVPFHRVLEYERLLAEARTAASVPDRPDLVEGDEPAAAIAAGSPIDVEPVVTEGSDRERSAAEVRTEADQRGDVPETAPEVIEVEKAPEVIDVDLAIEHERQEQEQEQGREREHDEDQPEQPEQEEQEAVSVGVSGDPPEEGVARVKGSKPPPRRRRRPS